MEMIAENHEDVGDELGHVVGVGVDEGAESEDSRMPLQDLDRSFGLSLLRFFLAFFLTFVCLFLNLCSSIGKESVLKKRKIEILKFHSIQSPCDVQRSFKFKAMPNHSSAPQNLIELSLSFLNKLGSPQKKVSEKIEILKEKG